MSLLGDFISKRFWAMIGTLITILIMLFPNNPTFRTWKQSNDNDPAEFAPVIAEAIKNRDVDYIESLMCQNIKDNTDNLHGKIKNILDSFDGEITEIEWKNNFILSEGNQDGSYIALDGIIYHFKTDSSDEKYRLEIEWQTINVTHPEETRIRLFSIQNGKHEYPTEPIYAVEYKSMMTDLIYA